MEFRMRQNKSLFPREIVVTALKQSFVKLKPGTMVRNPVMFTVYIVTIIMAVVCVWILAGEGSQGKFGYNLTIFLVLLITVLFANFAEAIAEARGKAQANSLRKTREDTPAKKVFPVAKSMSMNSKSSLLLNSEKAMSFCVKPGIRSRW